MFDAQDYTEESPKGLENDTGETPTWLERAVAIFDRDNRGDGDLLSSDWIRYALDVPVPRDVESAQQNQWLLLARMDAFRNYLLIERKIALQNVWSKGYRIVPPHEQAEIAAREAMGLVRRGLSKGNKLMTHVRDDLLTDEERRRHTDAHVRLSGITDMLNRQRQNIFALFRPQ